MFKGDRLRLLFFLASGLFVFLDLILKQLSLSVWKKSFLIFNQIGWAPTLNPGIAFGIHLPNYLIIILTLPTLCFFTYLIAKNQNSAVRIGLVLVILGAVSNLLDRIFYQHTIDYLQVYTSVFNIADVLIVVGVGLYLLSLKSREATQ